MDIDRTTQVLEALERENVSYVIFGGVALNLHGLARATQDLDLFVAPNPENIDRLRRALDSVFHDPELEQLSAADLLGDYPAVQYVPPAGDFRVDILTRLGEAYQFEDLDWETVPLGQIEVRVVTPNQLYEMKKDTVRPVDQGDAARLRDRFGFSSD